MQGERSRILTRAIVVMATPARSNGDIFIKAVAILVTTSIVVGHLTRPRHLPLKVLNYQLIDCRDPANATALACNLFNLAGY